MITWATILMNSPFDTTAENQRLVVYFFKGWSENAMKTDPVIEGQLIGGNYDLHHN